MGDYNRSTRELTLQEIPQNAVKALNRHIELHNLGDVLDDVLICIEAKAEKIKKGLFAPPGPKTSVSYVVVTKGWLFEAINAEGDAFHAISARLSNITVTDYEKSPFYSKIPDNGMDVNGMFTDATEQGMRFIGLGKDAAGEKFKEILIQAAQEAKR